MIELLKYWHVLLIMAFLWIIPIGAIVGIFALIFNMSFLHWLLITLALSFLGFWIKHFVTEFRDRRTTD